MKSAPAILSIIAFLCLLPVVHAESIDFSKCAANADHHCMEFIPQQNTGNQTNPNWHVTIAFPQTGAPQLDGIFSNDNFTHWKNDVAVMWVGNIYSTSLSPTMNFCPPAKLSLLNQGTPQYLNKFYNAAAGLDLTAFIYPKWCHIESGANPINGDNTISVPEFGSLTALILLSALFVTILTNRLRK